MKMFQEVVTVYLHRDPVDFRKSINGLSIMVEAEMALSPLSGALFVFCNKKRDKLKLLYWDKSGFALWYKRLMTVSGMGSTSVYRHHLHPDAQRFFVPGGHHGLGITQSTELAVE